MRARPAPHEATTGVTARVPREHQSRLGVSLVVDTSYVDLLAKATGDAEPLPSERCEEATAAFELDRMHRLGLINMTRTDVLGFELDQGDPEDLEPHLDQASQYVEHDWLFVLDHSRLDQGHLGGGGDQELLVDVFHAIAPDTPWGATSTTAKRRQRDAMHLVKAKKYGADGFVTTDEHDLLRRASAIWDRLDLRVCSPAAALAFVHRLRLRYVLRLGRAGSGVAAIASDVGLSIDQTRQLLHGGDSPPAF